uniref:Uncharacterized protein n=1 Tax=Trypanosoma vivax (strain Y486) TaxID=1055687 RepID=G0U0T3_TRYVY|nr:hypothetical protein TVY486_0802920 [Trypanosoma vivax Y486]
MVIHLLSIYSPFKLYMFSRKELRRRGDLASRVFTKQHGVVLFCLPQSVWTTISWSIRRPTRNLYSVKKSVAQVRTAVTPLLRHRTQWRQQCYRFGCKRNRVTVFLSTCKHQ